MRLFTLNDSAPNPVLDLKWESYLQNRNLGFLLDPEFVPPFLGRFSNVPSQEPGYIIADTRGGFEIGCFNDDEHEMVLEDEYCTSTMDCHPRSCRYYGGGSGEPGDVDVEGCEMQGYVAFYTPV